MLEFLKMRFRALGFLFAAIAAAASGELTPSVASYKIAVRFDEGKKTIEGTELLTWTNRTPRPARTLRFHLYLNAFRNSQSSYMREALAEREVAVPEAGWGSVAVSRMTSGAGEDLLANSRYVAPDDGNLEDRTVLEVDLPRPAAPGDKVLVAIEFVSHLPRLLDRTGYKGDFVFAGQWFPKVGVLEEKGWNCHQFHHNSEFFADFGNYDVEIDVPARLRGKVGATALLREEREAPGGRVIEHFRQESVHDFAWTADPNFEVFNSRFAEAGLPQTVVTLLCQPEHRRQAERYLKAAREALSFFGKRYGPYPYGLLTIVDPPWGAREEAGGMEYPTLITGGTSLLAAQGTLEGAASPEAVTIHEVAHQYFYGLLASNEAEEPWLDEGFATYAEQKFFAEVYRDSHPFVSVFGYPVVLRSVAQHPPLDTQLSSFDLQTRQPLTTSWKFENGRTYSRLVYAHAALTLATLERLIGPETMDRAMSDYTSRFRFEHPTTADFVACVNRAAGRDWSRFFRDTLFSGGTVDFAVARAVSERSHPPSGWIEANGRSLEIPRDATATRRGYDTEVVVERRGEIALPVEIELVFENGAIYKKEWDGAAPWVRFRVENGPKLKRAVVDPGSKILLDTDRNNNGWVVEGDAAAANLWTARVFFWTENLFDLFMELW
jgi:hypothetical protein